MHINCVQCACSTFCILILKCLFTNILNYRFPFTVFSLLKEYIILELIIYMVFICFLKLNNVNIFWNIRFLHNCEDNISIGKRSEGNIELLTVTKAMVGCTILLYCLNNFEVAKSFF